MAEWYKEGVIPVVVVVFVVVVGLVVAVVLVVEQARGATERLRKGDRPDSHDRSLHVPGAISRLPGASRLGSAFSTTTTMDSSSHRIQQERQRKEEIAKKIAALQAELGELPETVVAKPPGSPKRKRPEPKLLVPETPSPRKKRKTEQPAPQRQPVPQPAFKRAAVASGSQPRKSMSSSSNTQPPPSKPSNVLENLSRITKDSETVEKESTVIRTTAFTDQAIPAQDYNDTSTVKRDERLALIQDFEPGPYDHTPPSDDPTFEKLEPHSNIALKSRSISHEDFKDHLYGRYYLSPSQLYSCIRLQPDKQHYDVPIPGDWVTIAVVAERGPIRYTRAPVALEGDPSSAKPNDKWKNSKKPSAEQAKPTGRKYMNMKLIDFGARTKSSATGGKAVVRGDAFLSLLLFEAESVDLVDSGGKRPEKVYRGGSKGAFESLEKLKEGDVIALLNPRILKPYQITNKNGIQKSSDKPHPVDNILAVTPECASSIVVLGRARDLGMCAVKKKDGSVCGSWVDKRLSDVCEYHVQNAVQHRRAARPEFTAGTGGMSTSTVVKRKHDYDPARQWGLAPSLTSTSSSSTYIVSGHIVKNSQASMFNSENMGREGQAKAKRKLANDEVERQLKKMLERDREGMEVVIKAREAAQARLDASEAAASGSGSGSGSKESGAKGKGKGKVDVKAASGSASKKGKEKKGEDTVVAEFNKPKKAYSQSVIRSLGFDPTLRPGHRRGEITEDSQNKRQKLEALCSTRREIKLGPVPGPRKLSNIVAPPKAAAASRLDSEEGSASPPPQVEQETKDAVSAPAPAEEEDGMIDLDDF
ncbi:hypothetical protein D9611_001046 [Ephemerocybe angulata]|uniref:Zinc finger Mcm10/DnaG-type domain-containing protein n=1 Tax=Ephemerocybe angulata TaxID=980116 RepID=A0A8H5F795_9AGAR|nr:hypothetical protein D9611_001046 [Tulosesus angulatus]